MKLKKTIIKLKQNEINKVHTKGFVELLSQISRNFHRLDILVHYIDRTLMAGDWYCYGKSTVGSPSTVHTSTGLHTEMSVQSLQTDTKLW